MRQTIEQCILYSSFIFVLISIVFSSSIVWRSEQRLDASYKFFTLALLFFGLQLSLDTFTALLSAQDRETVRLFLQFFFAFFLLLGFWEMRRLVRDLDDEKQLRALSKKTRKSRQ